MNRSPFVPPSVEHPDDFLTVVDSHGASINFERADDGVISVWIAPPGENDGYPMCLGASSQQQVADYLRGAA